MILNNEIAEFIGMHVGDGTLYKTARGLVWELRGSINEKGYYYNHVVPLLYSIFNLHFQPKFRSGGKNGCFGIQTSKREVYSFLLDFGFKPGKKYYSVAVPDYILNSNKFIKQSFVRGVFDTDGCLWFGKDKNNVSKYPMIEIGSASLPLMRGLSIILNELGFRHYTWIFESKATRTYGCNLRICGEKMLEKWFNEVGSNNPKHLNKYFFFHENGFSKTHAAIA